MAFLIILLVLFVVALAALARGLFARNAVVAAVCIVLLSVYLQGVLWWPHYGWSVGLFEVFYRLVLLPMMSAALLADAAARVPLISVPSLALGAGAGLLAAWPLWRAKRPRVAALLFVWIFPLVAWSAAEALVTWELRSSAARQFPSGYCTVLSRLSVTAMIRQRTYEERGEHVTLIADGADYYWSFRERRFVPRGHSGVRYRCDPARRL